MIKIAASVISALFLTTAIAADTVSLDNPRERYIKNVAQLTFDGDNGEAYFSWDGKKLIWQSNRGGEACDKIWTMNIDGSNKEMVSPAYGAHTCSFFLPGDDKIVFSSTADISESCPERVKIPGKHYVWGLYPYDIMVADADGSARKNLTADNPDYDAEPVVSSDGKRIVFGSKRGGDFNVYTMDIDGGNVKKLTDTYGYDGGPWWSPDGTMIAWRGWHPENDEEKKLWADAMEGNYIVPVPLDLWVMNSDGSGKRRLTDNGATNWAPSWHPDGKRLIFSSNMDDWHDDLGSFGHNFELYMINIDGTGLRRLTYNDSFDSFPMFSPDGKKLAWGANRNPQKPRATDIFIADFVE
ncbi:MAG: hypothetical protein C0609_09435 [Deltaproteobacteria bacterium]|nr:MAG: hypothetical protein C0609_09435 [Deltaproteobacteria bacterium]